MVPMSWCPIPCAMRAWGQSIHKVVFEQWRIKQSGGYLRKKTVFLHFLDSHVKTEHGVEKSVSFCDVNRRWVFARVVGPEMLPLAP